MSVAPEISVVIPTYNRAGTLGRAVASVLSQEGPSLEAIVVDDGSSDGTKALAEGIRDDRLMYLRRPHRGVSAARNDGASNARAPLLAFLDSDDEARPGWLSALVEPFAAADVAAVSCAAEIVGPGGERETMAVWELGAAFGGQRGLFLAGAFAVRRDLFAAVGGYAEDLAFSENTELALRLLPECRRRGLRVETVDRALLTVYRDRETGDTMDPDRLAVRLAASELLLSRHAETLRHDPGFHGKLLATAGVRAARLGDFRRARRMFRTAVAADPTEPRHLGRLLIATLPPIGRRIWGHGRSTAGPTPPAP